MEKNDSPFCSFKVGELVKLVGEGSHLSRNSSVCWVVDWSGLIEVDDVFLKSLMDQVCPDLPECSAE